MKTALVTGASSGIGWEIAKLLGEQGHHLILVARSEDKLLELKKLLQNTPITIDIIPLDLSLATAPQTLFEKVNSLGRTVDILVNNAGFGEAGAFSDIDLKRQADMIQVNVTTLTALTHLFLPAMKEKRSGHIVNIASVNGLTAFGEEAYSAGKAGVINLTRNMACKYAHHNVRVNVICPGTIATPLWAPRLAENPQLMDELAEMYPMGRVGQPEDVAKAALFLASEEASWITGITLPVDGGLMAYR